MKESKNNFIQTPSRKTVTLLSVLWLVSIVLLVLANTNLFSESFFQQKYVGTCLGMLGSTVAMVLLYTYYFKNTLKINHKFLETISSQKFLLLIGFVIVSLMLIQSSLGLNQSLKTIGTQKQWKFIASLASFILVLLMFLSVIVGGLVSYFKEKDKVNLKTS